MRSRPRRTSLRCRAFAPGVWCSCALLTAGPVALAAELNLLKNPSFERHSAHRPTGWSWQPGRAHAELTLDTEEARSGGCSIHLSNRAARAAHVYSSVSQQVAVRPRTTYTLSCYVKTTDGGVAWLGGGAKWQHRFPLPTRTDGWQRVTGTFTTAADETQFAVRILTESITPGFRVDDVQLEVGTQASPFLYEAPLAPGACRLRVESVALRPNLVPNASFEVIHGVRPQHWMWDRRNTDAEVLVDDTLSHSGTRSVKFTNGTAFGAHIYGWFGAVGAVRVKPDTVYTVSAYARGDAPGIAWFGGGDGWRVRCRIHATGGRWQRFSKTFQTRAEETNFPLMVVTESPTSGFWLDDLRLEEGGVPTPFFLGDQPDRPQVDMFPTLPASEHYKGNPVRTRWAESRQPVHACAFPMPYLELTGEAFLPEPMSGLVVELTVTTDAGQQLSTATTRVEQASQALRLAARVDVGDTPNGRLRVTTRLLAGQRVVTACDREIDVYTARGTSDLLAEVGRTVAGLAPGVRALEERGTGGYSRVVLAVLETFVPWVRSDIENGRIDRAWDTASVLSEMGRSETRRAGQILAGEKADWPTPRYRTSPLRILGPSIIGTQEHTDGTTVRGPVFFVGYGHFRQVRADIEKFPGYGCNFCQIEFGPRTVLPDEDTASDAAIEQFLSVCDRAATSGVSVNLLLSPHYFPNWALDKWPHLKDCQGGFFKYCVHAPESRSVIEASLRRVIPRIKEHPALHSVCLSNEPICVDLRKCRVTARAWPAWLGQKHGSIETLNARWRTQYVSFEDIPVPAPDVRPAPEVYDFVLFNQETFAEFHAWMTDIIHDLAPSLPVHAKIMMSAHFYRTLHGIWSVSPELFAGLSDMNGNDCVSWYARRGEWSNGLLVQQMAYDFQRSMADKPIFNSENHLIIDRDHDVIPPGHIYTTLWQEAIHGQSATTIWVWERTDSYTSSVAGSILHRPACVAAVGRACLDLNRLAEPVTALQRVKPRVALLWSLASVVQGDTHFTTVRATYRAASFLGTPLGFVTERQLQRYVAGGVVPPALETAEVLLVPEATHLPDVCVSGLQRIVDGGGAVVLIGHCLGGDEYGNARHGAEPFGVKLDTEPTDERGLFEVFSSRMERWEIERPIEVTTEEGAPAWGIETRSVKTGEGWIVNLCNHLREPQRVQLTQKGTPVQGRDLLSDTQVTSPFVLHPLQPLLIAVRKASTDGAQ